MVKLRSVLRCFLIVPCLLRLVECRVYYNNVTVWYNLQDSPAPFHHLHKLMEWGFGFLVGGEVHFSMTCPSPVSIGILVKGLCHNYPEWWASNILIWSSLRNYTFYRYWHVYWCWLLLMLSYVDIDWQVVTFSPLASIDWPIDCILGINHTCFSLWQQWRTSLHVIMYPEMQNWSQTQGGFQMHGVRRCRPR